MKFKATTDGYKLWLSGRDTQDWATRPTSSWPCSTLRGKSLFVEADRNGLCDIAVNGRNGQDVGGAELDAIVSDHVPQTHRHLWPVWGKQVSP